jgi:hypothetical protein
MCTIGVTCPKGTVNCPGDPPNTCATMLGTNLDCAYCGDACDLPNANSQCELSNGQEVCALVTCNQGFADCDMVAANGCEVNTTNDPNNCNVCGSICPPPQMCVDSVCM